MSYTLDIKETKRERETVLETPPTDILLHVYRSVKGEVDREGCLVPLALAVLIKNQMELCPNWTPPNIVFGADLREAFDDIPLYQTYSKAFINAAEYIGLSPLYYRIITPNSFGESPVGTKTELTMFQTYLNMVNRSNNDSCLVFGREPHMDRITYLAKMINLNTYFLSAEAVFRILEYRYKETLLFQDTRDFGSAEFRKQIIMMFFDQSGNRLEWISKFSPKFKNLLLDLIGNRR